jgi:D-psicose/D-tagatose/L-ribulose 3-epimerase
MGLDITLGVSTWLFTSPFQTSDAAGLFEKISQMGFDKVEIAVEDLSIVDAAVLKDQLRQNGLQPLICGAFGPTRDLTNDDPAIQKIGLDYIESCLELAATVGASFVAGPMYAAVGKARMLPPEQRKIEWHRAVSNLQKVAEMASSRGLEIALEPLNRFESDLINTTDDVLRLIADINHPAAKIGLDMFHMNIEESDPKQAIIDAGDKLIHLQVAENYRGTPGTGSAPWKAYYEGLEAIQYQGTVCIESFTPANKELAAAVCIWRDLASSQDAFAEEGLRFLQQWKTGNF